MNSTYACTNLYGCTNFIRPIELTLQLIFIRNDTLQIREYLEDSYLKINIVVVRIIYDK